MLRRGLSSRPRALAVEPLEDRRVPAVDYTLQILHASDLEAGLGAFEDAPNFAAVVDRLEDQQANSILLSSGDNYIAGPFFNAGGDPALASILGTPSVGRADIEVMNRIGFDASALGNHEFDQGTREIRTIIVPAGSGAAAWRGALFPYLSANLNFANDTGNLADRTIAAGQDTSAITAGRIAPSVTITRGGQKIGVIGVTTPLLASISSPGGGVGISPSNPNDLAALAAIVQAQVDALEAAGVNKIVLISHLQQFSVEQALAPLLRGVDVVIAGGSDFRLADNTDILRPGEPADGSYPVQLTSNVDGRPILLVSTDGNYRYVGRLVLGFDAAGVIDLTSLDPAVNGAYATDDAGVARVYAGSGLDPFAAGTKGASVKQVTDAVMAVVNAKDGNLAGLSAVYLNGLRAEIRTEETNLGNLVADATLAAGRAVDPTVAVSINNAGGIRDSIGTVNSDTGARTTTSANAGAGKQAGQVSQLDIENSLRFNNGLSLVTVTAANLKRVLEHAVAAVAPGATPGQFAQVGGLRFSYDATRTAQMLTAGANNSGVATVTTEGQRVRNAVIIDDKGNVVQVLVQDGVVVGDPARLIRLAIIDFLVNDPDGNGLGGDNYPFPTFMVPGSRVDLTPRQQSALTSFLQARFPTTGNASFAAADTPASQDGRIQNLAARADTVLAGALTPTVTAATTAEDTLSGGGLVVTRNAANGAEVTHFRVTAITGGRLFLADGVTEVTNGSFITVAQGAAGLRFLPSANFAGTASFQVQASLSDTPAGLGGAAVVARVTVTPVNDAPVGRADSFAVQAGATLTVPALGVLANDADVDSATLRAVLVSGPAQGALTLNPDGSFVFTPAAGFTGVVTFTYAVTDGTATSAPVAVTVTVTAGPVAPTPGTPVPGTPVPGTPINPVPGRTVTVTGSGNFLQVRDPLTGDVVRTIRPFNPAFAGVVRHAAADLNGDGSAEVVAAAGPGAGPHVLVFDGATGNVLFSFFAFAPGFTGGLSIALADLTGDGTPDLIAAAGPGGGPVVSVFDGTTMALVRSFFAFDPVFSGGVEVAAGLRGGAPVIFAAAGPGGGPVVKTFDATGEELASVFAFDPLFTGGVFVAAVDADGDGTSEVVASAGAGGGPAVRLLDQAGAELASFFAFDPLFLGGVRVAAGTGPDGTPLIVTGAGQGGGPRVTVRDARTLGTLDDYFAAAPDSLAGVFVG